MSAPRFTRKFDLQRQVLASWDRLQTAKAEHTHLLAQLNAVRSQLESAPLFDELFSDLT